MQPEGGIDSRQDLAGRAADRERCPRRQRCLSRIDLDERRSGPDGGVSASRYAFLGVRSCDLHAIAIQDRILVRDRFVDRNYEARRRNAFIVAVNCSQYLTAPASCASVARLMTSFQFQIRP